MREHCETSIVASGGRYLYVYIEVQRVKNSKRVFPIFIDPANRKFIAVERIKGIPTRSRLCQNHGVVCARHEATAPADKMRKTVVNFFFSSGFFFLSNTIQRFAKYLCTEQSFLFSSSLPPFVSPPSGMRYWLIYTDKYRSIYIIYIIYDRNFILD